MSIDVQSATSSSGPSSQTQPEPVLQSGAPPAAFLQPSGAAVTISELFLRTVQTRADQEACKIVKPEEPDPQRAAPPERQYSVIPWKWKEYGEAATCFAKALIASGVRPQEVVTIQGSNSPEWLTAHIGTILAGGVSAGVYPTNKKEICEHIVQSSRASIAVVENEEQLEKYDTVQSTALKCIVVWNKVQKRMTESHIPVLSLDKFVKRGRAVPDTVLKERIIRQRADDPCTLVYTSGTTGNPKAATLTHRNLGWTAARAIEMFSLKETERGIGFLPLSHVAPMLLDCIIPLYTGHSVYIAPPDAHKGTNLKDHIVRTKPTYFLGVPRVWIKFKEAIEAKVASSSFLMRHAFAICTTIGRAVSSDEQALSAHEGSFSLFQKIRQVFDRCVIWFLEWAMFGKVKAALGLDQCHITASGAGSLPSDVQEFFRGLNIHLIDIYGMSESSAPISLPDDTTPSGSCGKPIPGTEVRIINPNEHGEGEIIVRGPNIFAGYWNDPEATRAALDEDGFLHTGDQGRIDGEGYLYVTDRIKELIKTSGGENIPPLRIEERIKTQLPIVSQAVVTGNNKNFLTCLISLKTELDDQGAPTKKLAPEVIAKLRTINSTATTVEEAAVDRKVQDFLMQGIARANQLADSHAQHVQKVCVLLEDLSISNETLTPTLKLRRGIIERRYQQQITAMYA